MFSRATVATSLFFIFGSVSAEEGLTEPALEVDGRAYTLSNDQPLIWTPTSNNLSRYTLKLPELGVKEAIQYQDTASLFYLSQMNDGGLSLLKNETGTFKFRVAPKQSQMQYQHALTQALAVNIGIKVEEGDLTPRVAGEIRSVTGNQGLQQGSLGISKSSLDLYFAHTELNLSETHEKIWTLSLHTDQLRFAYGRRWFDVIENGSLLAEIGLNNKDPILGVQLEQSYDDVTGYLGVLRNMRSGDTEALLGIRYNFSNKANIQVESGGNLMTNSVQSLHYLRRNTIPKLWRSQIKITRQ